MKTAFRAKIIFESDLLENDDPNSPNPDNKPVFTLLRMREAINKGITDIECILGYYTEDLEPVIIIKAK